VPAPTPWSSLKSAGVAIFALAAGLLLLSGLMFYADETESTAPFLLAIPVGVVLAIPLTVLSGRGRAQAPGVRRVFHFGLLVLAFAFFGWMLGVGGLLTLNAQLDGSPPELRPVAIRNFWQT